MSSDQFAGMTMDQWLGHVSEQATDTMPADVAARVASLVPRFDAAVEGRPAAPLNIVVFHMKVPEEHRYINYVDVKGDHGSIDYKSVLSHFFTISRAHHPDCRIVFITGESDETDFVPDDVIVVRLPLNPAWLMYERVVAVNGFMQSKAFAANTVLLDGDAFPNHPLGRVFQLPFDVAVTFRDDPGFVPLNEGVIFAAARDIPATRAFFWRYLATYEALCRDERVIRFYNDIKRWRGGQLSLNATAAIRGAISEADSCFIAGAVVRYLPCSDYNYFFSKKNASYPYEVLRRKYVLHLKGGLKNVLEQIRQMQLAAVGKAPEAPAAPAPAAPPAEFIAPTFTLFNKEYNKPPFSDPAVRKTFMGHIQGAASIMGSNKPGTGAVAVDDMMVWFRNAAFLGPGRFADAFRPFANDSILRARIWRVYMLCWAAASCLKLSGDFMDVGCYDGKTVEVMARYCGFDQVQDKTWWLYDMFENPPEEARKGGHGPQLFDQVRQRVEPLGRFRVIKGAVPDSFAQGLPEKVAFAQLDLNVAAPELAALEILYDRMVPGGMIVFDDFGFRRYRDSHDAETAFLQSKGDVIWESPTGQGLFIKR